MSIGLMDADIATYTLVPFNLEIMKLSSYYKRKGELVVLTPQFTPDRHQLFFYRKDYDDGIYPPALLTANNVTYGGYAFTNNQYVPMDEAIEVSKPDPYIYSRLEKTMIAANKREGKKIFQNMLQGEHCRLSLDNKTIWSKYEKQFTNLSNAYNILLHDYNLGAIENSIDVVQDILKHGRSGVVTTKVGMKFPVELSDSQQLLKWTDLNPNSTFYSLRFCGVIDNDAFMELVSKARQRSIYKELEYCITRKSSSENDFIKNHLRQIFHQVIISRSYRVFFSLKYDDGFFFDKRWERVIDLINFYHNSYRYKPTSQYLQKVDNDTLFNFAENMYQYPPFYYPDNAVLRKEARELFQFVRVAAPDLFTDFYECSFNSLGGTL